ncbi:MAG: uncharacterized protein KVP18_004983 [Porospora cf. gigantea A]|uniref:uncharacterized protein n=1 Tax=Porospora cf. gigantea A TaxID=2853593 RepID=UPI00355AA426|nr:MAG: hypothetical protein KVP18_004983 [Porospora cf. gigantea A]
MPLMRSSSLGSSDLNDNTDSQITDESSPDEFSGDETESESRGRDQSCEAPHALQPLKIQKVGVKVRPTELLKESTSQKLVVWKRLCLREEESPQQACQFYESLTSHDKGIPAVCRVRTQMLDLAFRHIDDYHIRTYSDEVFALTVQLFDTTLASPRFRGVSAELAKRDRRHLTGVPIGKRGLVALTWGCVTLAAKSIHVKHFNPYRLGDCVKTSVSAVKTAELAVFASVDCRVKPCTSVGFLQALTGFTDDPLKCSRSQRQMYYLALFLLFCGLMQPHYLKFTSKTLALAATYLALRPFELSGLRGDRPTFASLLEEVKESM